MKRMLENNNIQGVDGVMLAVMDARIDGTQGVEEKHAEDCESRIVSQYSKEAVE